MKPRKTWVFGGAAVVLLIAGLLVTSTLFPTKKSIEQLFNDTVASVEIFEYEYGTGPSSISRTVITSGEAISELTSPFKDMPVTKFRGSSDELQGRIATAFRFHLENGEVLEAMWVFIDNQNSVAFWPDGSVNSTKWGRPLEGFYDEIGKTEIVSGDLIPKFKLE